VCNNGDLSGLEIAYWMFTRQKNHKTNWSFSSFVFELLSWWESGRDDLLWRFFDSIPNVIRILSQKSYFALFLESIPVWWISAWPGYQRTMWSRYSFLSFISLFFFLAWNRIAAPASKCGEFRVSMIFCFDNKIFAAFHRRFLTFFDKWML